MQKKMYATFPEDMLWTNCVPCVGSWLNQETLERRLGLNFSVFHEIITV